MTQLTEWMDQGITVQISEQIEPDTVFAYDNLRVVHPLNYSYLSNDDPFVAHEINMLRIQKRIDKMADEAIMRLDRMVDEMTYKHDPKMVFFMPNVDAIENEDGTYTFKATAGVGMNAAEIYRKTKQQLSRNYIKGYAE